MVDDLEQFIRGLVSDAVSVTPPPPDIDGPGNRLLARRPWLPWAAGAAVLAAVVGITMAVVLSGDDDEIRTATQAGDTTIATSVATSTTAPATTLPPASTTTAAPDTTPTTAPPTTPPAAVVELFPEPAPTLVTAGNDGVWVVSGAERVQWVTEPVAGAVMLADGVLVQRRAGYSREGWTAEDTELFSVASPGAPLEPFLATVAWGADPWLRLHDAAVIDGRLTVLVEVQPESTSLESPLGRLVTVTVGEAGPELTVLDDGFGGWESGSSRMHLSRTGLVVGEYSVEISRQLVAYSLGSVPAPGAAELGVEVVYTDCSDCPRLYTVSDDGTTIAWLDGTQLVRYDVESATRRAPVELGARALAAAELDLADGAVVLDPYPPFDGSSAEPSWLITFTRGESQPTLLSGFTGAFGPGPFTTGFEDASGDIPEGVTVNTPAAPGSAEATSALLARIGGLVATQPYDCTEVARQFTRVDDSTIRVRTGCDDSVGGVDYRIVDSYEASPGVVAATVERRTLCLRGVFDDLCV